VASQAPQTGVVAYDKATGEIKWKTDSLTQGAGLGANECVPSGKWRKSAPFRHFPPCTHQSIHPFLLRA
jgi:hypothetical protein